MSTVGRGRLAKCFKFRESPMGLYCPSEDPYLFSCMERQIPNL
jgi:hypothetical protein